MAYITDNTYGRISIQMGCQLRTILRSVGILPFTTMRETYVLESQYFGFLQYKLS